MAGVTAALLKRPGWWRALTYTILAAAFGFALVVVLRKVSGLPAFQTEQTGYPQVIVPAITAPLGFLVGIGCFDYWLRWAVGAPTFPKEREHDDHGAYSWHDYFKVNTDHKVIGIQYICTTFIFFLIGGLMAMIMRAELAQPGTQIVTPGTFNSLFSAHAAIMIFVFVIPVFAGIANYVLPLMIGRRIWRSRASTRSASGCFPSRGFCSCAASSPPAAPSTRVGRATPRYRPGPRSASRSSTWESSSRGPHRSP